MVDAPQTYLLRLHLANLINGETQILATASLESYGDQVFNIRDVSPDGTYAVFRVPGNGARVQRIDNPNIKRDVLIQYGINEIAWGKLPSGDHVAILKELNPQDIALVNLRTLAVIHFARGPITGVHFIDKATIAAPEVRVNLTDFLKLLNQRGIDASRFGDLQTELVPSSEARYILARSGNQVAIAISGVYPDFPESVQVGGAPIAGGPSAVILYIPDISNSNSRAVRIETGQILITNGMAHFGFTIDPNYPQLAFAPVVNGARILLSSGRTVVGVRNLTLR